jgi:hypothetical protein
VNTSSENSILSVTALHRLIDNAAGELAVAEEVLIDLCALFEAIVAATKGHELAHRLAALGVRTADEYRESFEGSKETYNHHSRKIIDATNPGSGERPCICGAEHSAREFA